MGYEKFYRLKEHPFSFATDDKFYYDSPQHSKALVKLAHAVETEKGLALLIGDIGTGKTTLSRRLLDQLIDDGIEATLLVIIHSEITSLWFLKKIALMLETPVESENKIEIKVPGKLFGNIQTPKLVIEEGVIFEGNCKMKDLGERDLSLSPTKTDGLSVLK